ncbi:MAG: hypothetical protein VXZ04_05390 [Candidatus Thermoplasmatota archaeon]|nr:hypothetical protein [Candidatus Thermoplasmatota archaeon]
MNKKHDQTKQKNDHAKPNTFVVDGDGAWLVANGHQHPDELIDHDANLNEPEAFFGIFAAYNQHNIADGTQWDTWPSWELCLTDMDLGLHFLMPEMDTHDDWVQREHWLALAQTIHDHPSISMDGYAITVQGQNGHEFAFDFGLEIEKWGAPGTFAAHQARRKAAASKPMAWKWAPPAYLYANNVAHSLGEYWTCPNHIPEYGGETTAYTHDSFFCIDHLAGTFPSNVLSLILLCIEDHHIWVMQYEEAQNMQAYVEEMEREWPGGRPEDFEYQ